MKRRVQELIKDVVIVVLAVSLIVLAVLSLPAQSIRKSPFLSSLLQPLASLLGLEQAELAYLEVKEPVMGRGAAPGHLGEHRNRPLHRHLGLRRPWIPPLKPWAAHWDRRWTPPRRRRSPPAATCARRSRGRACTSPMTSACPRRCWPSWLDAAPEVELPQVDACALVIEGEEVALYLVGATVQKAATGLSAETLSPLLAQFRPDGSAFAFEVGATVDAFSLLPTGAPRPARRPGGEPLRQPLSRSPGHRLWASTPTATPPTPTPPA